MRVLGLSQKLAPHGCAAPARKREVARRWGG